MALDLDTITDQINTFAEIFNAWGEFGGTLYAADLTIIVGAIGLARQMRDQMRSDAGLPAANPRNDVVVDPYMAMPNPSGDAAVLVQNLSIRWKTADLNLDLDRITGQLNQLEDVIYRQAWADTEWRISQRFLIQCRRMRDALRTTALLPPIVGRDRLRRPPTNPDIESIVPVPAAPALDDAPAQPVEAVEDWPARLPASVNNETGAYPPRARSARAIVTRARRD